MCIKGVRPVLLFYLVFGAAVRGLHRSSHVYLFMFPTESSQLRGARRGCSERVVGECYDKNDLASGGQ